MNYRELDQFGLGLTIGLPLRDLRSPGAGRTYGIVSNWLKRAVRVQEDILNAEDAEVSRRTPTDLRVRCEPLTSVVV